MKTICGYAASILLGGLLSACSGKAPGTEFLGNWEPDKPGSGLSFRISKNGEAFLLVDNINAQYAAVYDTQTHLLNVSMGPVGNVPFSYIAATDHLSAKGNEFKRAQQDGPAATAGDGKTSSLNDDAVAFGKSLFAKGMVTCNGKTFIELSSSGGGTADVPGELKNPTFELDPVDGNAAGKGDNLNGIDFKGEINMRWEAYRFYLNHRWSDWLNGGEGPSIPSGVIRTSESVSIMHKHGQWVHEYAYSGQRDFLSVRKKPLTCDAVPSV